MRLLPNSTKDEGGILQDNDSIDLDIGDCSVQASASQFLAMHVLHAEEQENGGYHLHLGGNVITHISVRVSIDRRTFVEADESDPL
jgi:hypothetical protein